MMTLSINCAQTPWFALAPWELLNEPTLQAIADYLNQLDTQQALARLEDERTYPQTVRAALHRLGLSHFLLDPASDPATTDPQSGALLATFPHLVGLIILCTAANGTLGITVGVNMLALLPIYLAGNREQLAWMAERLKLTFCYGWFGSKLCADLRRIAYTVQASNLLDELAQAETTFGTLQHHTNYSARNS